MWMAEWFFTDLSQRAVGPPRRGDNCAYSNFRQVEAALADGSDQVANPRQQENPRKHRSEKQLRRDQFAHEVKLKYKKNRQSPGNSPARLRTDSACKLLQLCQDRIHRSSIALCAIRCTGLTKGTSAK